MSEFLKIDRCEFLKSENRGQVLNLFLINSFDFMNIIIFALEPFPNEKNLLEFNEKINRRALGNSYFC